MTFIGREPSNEVIPPEDQYINALKSGDWEVALEIKDKNVFDDAFLQKPEFVEQYEASFREVLGDLEKYGNLEDFYDAHLEDADEHDPQFIIDKLDKIALGFGLSEDFISRSASIFFKEQTSLGNLDVRGILERHFLIDHKHFDSAELIENGIILSLENGSASVLEFDLDGGPFYEGALQEISTNKGSIEPIDFKLTRKFIESDRFQKAVKDFVLLRLEDADVDSVFDVVEGHLNFSDEFFRDEAFHRAAILALEVLFFGGPYGDSEEEDNDIDRAGISRIVKTINLFGIKDAEVNSIAQRSFSKLLDNNYIEEARTVYSKFLYVQKEAVVDLKETFVWKEVERTVFRLLMASKNDGSFAQDIDDDVREAGSLEMLTYIFNAFRSFRGVFGSIDVKAEALRRFNKFKAKKDNVSADKISKMFDLRGV